MGELKTVPIEKREAARLADLASNFQDLAFCAACCERLLPLLKEDSQDTVLVRAFYSAALIAYARCFSAGKRFGLTEDVFAGLDGDPIGAHRYYIEMRNKHIAHSVNPFEQVKVGLILSDPDPEPKEVVGVSVQAVSRLSDDPFGVEQLSLLAKILQERVAAMCREADQIVLEAGKLLPVQELYNRPTLGFTAPGPDEVTKSRK